MTCWHVIWLQKVKKLAHTLLKSKVKKLRGPITKQSGRKGTKGRNFRPGAHAMVGIMVYGLFGGMGSDKRKTFLAHKIGDDKLQHRRGDLIYDKSNFCGVIHSCFRVGGEARRENVMKNVS